MSKTHSFDHSVKLTFVAVFVDGWEKEFIIEMDPGILYEQPGRARANAHKRVMAAAQQDGLVSYIEEK